MNIQEKVSLLEDKSCKQDDLLFATNSEIENLKLELSLKTLKKGNYKYIKLRRENKEGGQVNSGNSTIAN